MQCAANCPHRRELLKLQRRDRSILAAASVYVAGLTLLVAIWMAAFGWLQNGQ